MPILQISRITQRKGLSEDLPALAGAEFGWVIDQRRLFIGNGTLQEGAPAVGNTEVLTEYSDILNLASSYTYKGEAGGYTVQTSPSGTPVTRSLQAKLDDFASVKDFGAKGDGTTDDTDAINNAMYQLVCREPNNTSTRRSLFFPAGTYLVTDELLIPPFIKLYGEGHDSSIIKMSLLGTGDYVARTADTAQQVGASIANNGALAPQQVELYDLGFVTERVMDIFLVEDMNSLHAENVGFFGPLTKTEINGSADVSCVRFASTASYVCKDIIFNGCEFSGLTYAVNTEQQTAGVTFSNCQFDTLYRGIVLGETLSVNGGPTGVRIVQNLFDNIFAEGILLGNVSNNASGYNIFLDVGNEFNGAGFPSTAVISIDGDNNVSLGDMFERDETDNLNIARININAKKVFALDKGERYQFGTYQREAGQQSYLEVTGTSTNIFNVAVPLVGAAFIMEYRYQDATSSYIRYGRMTVVGTDGAGTLSYFDDYVENGATGLTLSAQQIGDAIYIDYVSSSEGYFKYSLSHF